jgi:hypothetical protein
MRRTLLALIGVMVAVVVSVIVVTPPQSVARREPESAAVFDSAVLKDGRDRVGQLAASRSAKDRIGISSSGLIAINREPRSNE